MLQSFGWLFFWLIAIVLIGVAAFMEFRRRRRAIAERRAIWKAHQDWLRSSEKKEASTQRPSGEGT